MKKRITIFSPDLDLSKTLWSWSKIDFLVICAIFWVKDQDHFTFLILILEHFFESWSWSFPKKLFHLDLRWIFWWSSTTLVADLPTIVNVFQRFCALPNRKFRVWHLALRFARTRNRGYWVDWSQNRKDSVGKARWSDLLQLLEMSLFILYKWRMILLTTVKWPYRPVAESSIKNSAASWSTVNSSNIHLLWSCIVCCVVIIQCLKGFVKL